MAERKIILVTGHKGLIGGALYRRLKESGENVVGVDIDVNNEDGVDFRDLFRYVEENHDEIGFIFHLGANTNALETDEGVFKEYNLGYSKSLWYKCVKHKIPIVYASSSATYGNGELGFSDNLSPENLRPLNKYGESKNDFDKFVIQHSGFPPYWAGIKFFNVYGLTESHKGKMGSLIYQAYSSIKKDRKFDLYEKERERDFIYVEDVVDFLIWAMQNRPNPDLYNLGTGESFMFSQIVLCVFEKLNIPVNINYIRMPDELLDTHQFYTKADISKLRKAGFDKIFTPISEGISKYIDKLENKI